MSTLGDQFKNKQDEIRKKDQYEYTKRMNAVFADLAVWRPKMKECLFASMQPGGEMEKQLQQSGPLLYVCSGVFDAQFYKQDPYKIERRREANTLVKTLCAKNGMDCSIVGKYGSSFYTDDDPLQIRVVRNN